ncbi:lysophospholipid acyltransferase family protein [Brachybacterium squillarum]|uniref:lysophospholipid acyltransferase family protein n=1 Tax=Brachybacterium squillarum TaxID=661979 RepID=UPI002221DA31|nr:lysophospholipid acyltransferase family protein [Brachybacterium squillarum]MCW1803749.1 1-acyl-sn-glycerol-3-phosphate acyltransferase [Brachybacterium squillarum]
MLYDIAKGPVREVIRAVWRPDLRGAARIPSEGPVVLASNHCAYSDTVILPALIERTVHFLGKSDMFSGRSAAGRAAGLLMRQLRVMPVDRTGGSASEAAIEAGLEVLRDGGVLGIYPEGTRSPDGRLHRGKTGVARIALAAGAPIVPVAMIGSFEAQRGRRFLPRRHPRIRVLVGEPIDAAAIARSLDGAGTAVVLRAVTDAVMDAIAEISGQERVDEYAGDVKRRLREAGSPTARDARRR